MSAIAIFPARGGSKRIPRKNIKKMEGIPIIEYPISECLKSNIFSEIMVSTDDEEIAQVGKSAGALVPFLRSSKNSDDYATTLDVLKEVVAFYETKGRTFKYICCIYPTAVLLNKKDLIDSFKKLREGKFDSIISTTSFDFPPLRGFRINNSDNISYMWPEHKNTRSQDLPELCHDAGMFYWAKWDVIKNSDSLVTQNSSFWRIPNHRAQDIDTPQDWIIANLKLKANFPDC